MKKALSGARKVGWYKWNILSGFTIYSIGWIIWLVSLCLPIDYVAQGAWTHPDAPLPTALFLIFTALMPVFAVFKIHLYWPYLLLWLYYPGLLAALVCVFRLRSPILFVFLRLCSLALLEVWVWELMYLLKDRQGTFYWGGTVLAVGSTLICLGVWLIPPRQKGEDAGTRKQSADSRAGPGSISGGE